LERALQTLHITRTSDPALELHLNAALGDAILLTTGSSPGVTAAFNRTLQLAEQLGTTVHHRRALWGLWLGRIAASDYQSAVGFAEAFRLFIDGSCDPDAMLTCERMMALAYHFSGNQAIARGHAQRALRQPARPIAILTARADRAFQFEHRVAAHADRSFTVAPLRAE
jgi:hypothetical protein